MLVATAATTNQNDASRPLNSENPAGPSLFSMLVEMEVTAATPTALPSWSAELNIAPTTPAMRGGVVWKIAMLQ